MGLLWEYIYYRIIDISVISDVEYIQLISNYNNAGEVDETDALLKRGYSEEQIAFINKDKKVKTIKSLNVTFNTKNKLSYPYLGYCLTLYNNYKNGILPFEGCLSDQPNKIIEIFSTIDMLNQEAEEKMRKKLEKESKRRGKN